MPESRIVDWTAIVWMKEVCMKRLVSIGLLLVLAAAIPVGASTFLMMSPSELVRDSAAVVQGTQPGDQRIVVEVKTDDLQQPIRREESTRVFGDQ